MNKPTKTAAELRADLATAQTEYARLGDELSAIEKKQAALEERRKTCMQQRANLDGGWRGYGEFKRLAAEIERAEQAEADAVLPRVTIGDKEHVVVKVTASRIFTREPGTSWKASWHHDGTPVAHGVRLRIPADALAKILAARMRSPDLPKSLGVIGSILTDVHAWKNDAEGGSK